MEEDGPRGVDAHRRDHRPSHGRRRRLRGGDGAAVESRRRTRRLPHHRRRRDLGPCAGDRREHRRRVPGDGPARPRGRLRRELPAAAAHLDAHRRRPRQRGPQDHGRRRDLAQDHQGPARRRPRPHRPGPRAEATRHHLRDRRGRGRQGGLLPLARRRRELGADERLRVVQPAVLPGDPRRPGRSRPRLQPRHVLPGDRGRRQDLVAREHRGQARGRPRPVDRSRQQRPPAHRLRRRHLRDLGPLRELALLRQPAGHPVLSRGRGRRAAVLQRLRRHAGQQHAGRALAHHQPPGHHQPRLVHHRRRRRLRAGHRARQPRHRLQPVAARRPHPLRPPERRADRHPAPARRGRGAALELGLALPHQPAQPAAALLRQPARLPQRRPRRQLARHQRRPDRRRRPQQAAGDGPGVEHRHRRQEPVDQLLRQHRLAGRIAAAGRPDLGRHGRRAHPAHPRRRRELDQDRQGGQGARGVVRGLFDALALRRGHRLRLLRQPQAGRPQAVRLRQPRLRPQLDRPHRRPARARHGLHAAPGSRRPRSALRRHRVRRVVQRGGRQHVARTRAPACP